MAASGTLNTFGAIMTFAIELERRLADYYGSAGAAALAKAADKRRKKLERARRENVVEITLEPIAGLDAADYALELGDDSAAGQAAVSRRRSMCARRSGRWSAVARSMGGWRVSANLEPAQWKLLGRLAELAVEDMTMRAMSFTSRVSQ